MKFVKDNLPLLICGLVAVLFLAFAFAPIPYAVPGFSDDLITSMQHRFEERDLIAKWSKETIELPGWPPAKGIPPQSWVDAKNRLINGMNAQQKEVESLARQYNVQGRLDPSSRPERPVPLLPIPLTADMSRVGKPIPGFLPKKATDADAQVFKEEYGSQFLLWRGLLSQYTLTRTEPSATLPPKAEDIKRDFDELQAIKAGKLPPGAGAGMGGGMGGSSAQSSKELWAFQNSKVTGRALNLRMYVEQDAFQIRNWYALDSEPNAEQMFEALVDSWLQSDLVKAIRDLNYKENPRGSVAASPVKRLTRVVVGANARNRFLNNATPGSAGGGGVTSPTSNIDPGQLFFTSNSGSPAGGVSTMTPVTVQGSNAGQPTTRSTSVTLPETANQTNYDLGMTGRAAGKTYDVVYMSVVLDIDPGFIFKFIESLYRQNMCYTVTNVQMRAVDPLDRASFGYVYGDPPVIEVEFLVECILFRGWTEPLMPDKIRETLGGQAPAGG